MLSGVAQPLLLVSVYLQAKATIAVADAELYTQEQQVCLHRIHVLMLGHNNVDKYSLASLLECSVISISSAELQVHAGLRMGVGQRCE